MSEHKFPTEVIDLPSRGKVYSKDSPLKDGKIELKYMTTREEDILMSENLIRKVKDYYVFNCVPNYDAFVHNANLFGANCLGILITFLVDPSSKVSVLNESVRIAKNILSNPIDVSTT